MTCADALRELVQAALRFELKAAHHRRIETERATLREAITRAQLLLSVSGPPPATRSPLQSTSLLRPVPLLKALKGGKSKGTTRRGTVKQKNSRKPS
jgi:hypothetical protein